MAHLEFEILNSGIGNTFRRPGISNPEVVLPLFFLIASPLDMQSRRGATSYPLLRIRSEVFLLRLAQFVVSANAPLSTDLDVQTGEVADPPMNISTASILSREFSRLPVILRNCYRVSAY